MQITEGVAEKVVNADTTIQDIIIVGGGHSSADFIPHLYKAHRGRVRGVVFIDHDEAEIANLQKRTDADRVQLLSVALRTPASYESAFRKKTAEFSVTASYIQREIGDKPLVIRVMLELYEDDIFSNVLHILPDTGTIRFVFAFGITGTTSSTVAIECARMIRKRVGKWKAEIPRERTVSPTYTGIGLFPPDPTSGAGDHNIAHGHNVSRVLSFFKNQTAESNKPGLFDKFRMIDASGFGGSQDIKVFNDWASITASTALTAQRLTDSGTFVDHNELFNDPPDYANVALVRAGCMPMDRDMAMSLGTLADLDMNVSDVNRLNELRENVDKLRKATESLSSAENSEAVQLLVERVEAVEMIAHSLEEMVKDDPEEEISKLTEAINKARELAEDAQYAYDNPGFWGKLGFGRSKRQKAVDESIDNYQNHEDALKKFMESVGRREEAFGTQFDRMKSEAGETAEAMQEIWKKRQFAHMWVMPSDVSHWMKHFMRNNYALPLNPPRETPNSGTLLSDQQREINAALDSITMHVIDPQNTEYKIDRMHVSVIGSDRARGKGPGISVPPFRFPRNIQATHRIDDDEWVFKESENIDEDHPLTFLVFWEPELGDGRRRVLPLYYVEKERIGDTMSLAGCLPREKNAWPDIGDTYADTHSE